MEMAIVRDGKTISLTDMEIMQAHEIYRRQYMMEWVEQLYDECTDHEFGDKLTEELLKVLYEEYMDIMTWGDGLGECEHAAFETAYEKFRRMMGV